MLINNDLEITSEDALETLEDLANLFLKADNEKSFKRCYLFLSDTYNFIKRSFSDPKVIEAARKIIENISVVNPKLDAYVDIILDDPFDFSDENNDDKDPFEEYDGYDADSLYRKIDFYANVIHNMQTWDDKEVEDIKYMLEKYKKELIEHKALFDDQKYNYLMNQINSALAKITKFFEVINNLPTNHYY